MSNKTDETTNEVVEVKTTKVNRRGIASARGTTRMKFDHKQALPNGLFLGHLDNVEVKEVTIGEETSGLPSFNGLSVPQIIFTFASNEEDANKRKYVTLRFMAVESNSETIPGKKDEWKFNQPLDYIKHILNVYVFKNREITDEEAELLTIDYEDFDENGDYLVVQPEIVIEAWKKFFNNVVNILYNDGKPHYKDKNGKFITTYLKLIRYFKNGKNGWKAVANGDLAFPTFVGEGVIEIVKQNTTPAIRIDVIREDIRPRQIETSKKPNMPNIPGMANTNTITNGLDGIAIADPMASPNGVILDAGDDMPF